MKDIKMDKLLQDEYCQEVTQFLCLCGEKDQKFLDIPKRQRKTEDYARLICISITLGFKKIAPMLVKDAEKKIDEVFDYLVKKQDLLTVYKWMDDFINNVPLPELRQLTMEFWNEKKQNFNIENFDIKSLL